MQNQEVRRKSRENKIPLWKVAEHLNISEPTMTRKLRHELSPEEKAKILTIIDELSQEQEAG